MTEYALAPTSNFTADSPYRTPRVMLEQGLLRAYRVRSNGTMRHLDLLPLDSTKRETAEWISDAVDYDGRSVQSVGRELNISVPTVRRFLESLALTEEIEAGEWDGLSFDSTGNPTWDTAWVESEVDAEELAGDEPATPAPAPQPTRRTSTAAKPCMGGCGKGVTARNSAAKLRAAMGYEDMCAVCYDQAGLENEHSDGHHADEPNADCPQCKDKILLARNRARFTDTAQPTDEEVEATKHAIREEKAARETQVPGAQCEPEGTPADEVEAVLAASVAAQGAALPMCFCAKGGPNAHTPGAGFCTNAPIGFSALGPIPRRTRNRG